MPKWTFKKKPAYEQGFFYRVTNDGPIRFDKITTESVYVGRNIPWEEQGLSGMVFRGFEITLNYTGKSLKVRTLDHGMIVRPGFVNPGSEINVTVDYQPPETD